MGEIKYAAPPELRIDDAALFYKYVAATRLVRMKPADLKWPGMKYFLEPHRARCDTRGLRIEIIVL